MTLKYPLFDQTLVYPRLIDAVKSMPDLRTEYSGSDRFNKYSVELDGCVFDYSKQLVNDNILNLLFELAYEVDLPQKIDALFKGENVNTTENQAATHCNLRSDVNSNAIQDALDKMQLIKENLLEKGITDIISCGIGGSDLGPRLALDALSTYSENNFKIDFLSNTDGQSLSKSLENKDPATTAIIINSKSFSTLETLTISNKIKDWYPDDLFFEHSYAVTANPGKAIEYGFRQNNILVFDKTVGGRFSIWSYVGLPIFLFIGKSNFEDFLNGANYIDEHFQKEKLNKNIPVIMALLGILNINFYKYKTQCVMPYQDGLSLLPEYLSQLEMESNGKSCNIDSEKLNYDTSAVIFGGVGCNGQHAFMQHLHQSTIISPVDFIAFAKADDQELQDILIASCFGQSQALMTGQENETVFKSFSGNRPSTTILFNYISPKSLGMLIAMYEHKVFVQGAIWGINSFDQWGVQLGKELINKYLNNEKGDLASECLFAAKRKLQQDLDK